MLGYKRSVEDHAVGLKGFFLSYFNFISLILSIFCSFKLPKGRTRWREPIKLFYRALCI